MAKSSRTPASSRSTSTSSRRARSAPVSVSKPKPWGTIALSAVLAVVLVGIVVYAATNQGAGAPNALRDADKSFGDLKTYSGLKRDHVNTPVSYPGYPGLPPTGGEHNPVPQSCQSYDQQIAPEHAVHSLEHGAVWITYRPDLPADQVKALTTYVDGNPYRLLSPLPGQSSPVVLTAWGRQLPVKTAGDKQVEKFLDEYTNGPQTPEKGAACEGTTAPGTAPLTDSGATGATPEPSAGAAGSAAPTAAPSAAPSAGAQPSASATP